MKNATLHILKTQNILSHENQGILIAKMKGSDAGITLANDVLGEVSDHGAMIYLSGGRTPKDLYKKLAEEEVFDAGAVGLIDERFGPKWHENSNERMIRDTGLLRYLQMRDIPFYPILSPSPQPSPTRGEGVGYEGNSPSPLREKAGMRGMEITDDSLRKQTAKAYDMKVRELHAKFAKSIGVLGVGMDGHTAGLPAAQISNPKTQNAKLYETFDLVTEYNDEGGFYGERVTMTFLGLSMLDLLLVLVFGDDKKDALEKMFSDGKEEDVPSRFFKRPEIAAKTLIITDQGI